MTGVHAAAIAVVTVGQVGTWIGPLLVGMLAGALDASATGPDAWRDRVAVAGYYASFVSFVQLLGLAAWEQRAFGDYNWRVTGAVFSLIFHGALLLAMFGGLIGPTRPLAVSLAARVKFGGTESATAKINQTLMGWTAGAAIFAPMSGDGGWGAFVAAIASVTTGMWGAIVGFVMRWLGG